MRQEKFDNYMVVNMIGGKSWKIDNYYVGFFASVNNILDKKYRTGGFEQGRNANYQELLQDTNNPIFLNIINIIINVTCISIF